MVLKCRHLLHTGVTPGIFCSDKEIHPFTFVVITNIVRFHSMIFLTLFAAFLMFLLLLYCLFMDCFLEDLLFSPFFYFFPFGTYILVILLT